MTVSAPSRPADASAPRALLAEERLAGLAMATVCLITLANVLVRYFTNFSFGFTEEVSVFLLVVMTLAGSAAAFRRGAHLAMPFLLDRLPAMARRVVVAAGLLVGFALFAAIVWYGGWLAWDDYDLGSTSTGIGVPAWWYSVWLPLLSLVICARILQTIMAVLRGREPVAEIVPDTRSGDDASAF
ncbi:MAG: TRAP transporter small permease [Burkholderiaceae bacterium]